MGRNVENADLVDAKAITLRIPTVSGGEIPVGAVISGRRLLLLVDEFPLQSWCRAHASDLLQAVVETGNPVKELRIYSDTHK